MIGVIIITHGNLADVFLEAFKLIMGEPKKIKAISLLSEDSPETLQRKISVAIEALSPNNGILVLVDILGGTPFNIASKMVDNEKMAILTGINLPMLFSVGSHQHEMDLKTLTLEAEKAAKESITNSFKLLHDQSSKNMRKI
jgi:PTS system mannose-specific IIA component